MSQLLVLVLGLFTSSPKLAAVPITTCQWPNTCSSKVVEVAQFQPCVWPNRCATEAKS